MFGPKEKWVVYDVEVARGPDEVVGKWENPEGMGFASAVTYSYEDDQYRFWLGLGDHTPLLQFLNGKTAITFNGIKFDSRVLLGNKRLVENQIFTQSESFGWPNCDLLLEYLCARFGLESVDSAERMLGDRALHDGTFSLDGLAEGTLGLHKTGHGAKAPDLYQNRQYAELLSYNLQDVRLTRKIFEYIRQYGFIVDRAGRVIRIKI